MSFFLNVTVALELPRCRRNQKGQVNAYASRILLFLLDLIIKQISKGFSFSHVLFSFHSFEHTYGLIH